MNYPKEESESAENVKRRQFMKQQQQLRSMAKTVNPISADDMIESLLSKKEIFQKKVDVAAPSSKSNQVGAWPSWIISGKEPPFYKQVWSHVAHPNGFADTVKLSSLLLSSRLTTDTLGYIWSLTNLTVPGSLTQQEVYISLALVALAQNGYTFTSGTVVQQLKEAPLPRLDLMASIAPITAPASQTFPAMSSPSVLSYSGPSQSPPLPSTTQPSSLHNSTAPQSNASISVTPPLVPSVPTVTHTLSLLDLAPDSPPKPELSLIDSSPSKTLSVLSATDLSKNYPPNNPTEPDLLFNTFQTAPNISGPALDDEFDDFKSADVFSTGMSSLKVLDVPPSQPPLPKVNDINRKSLELELLSKELFPKCPPQPKQRQSNTIPDLLPSIETVVPPTAAVDELALAPPPPSPPKDVVSPQPLTLTSEDKYSALRALNWDLDQPSITIPKSQQSQEFDEFGDFLTAESPGSLTVSESSLPPLINPNMDIQLRCLKACLEILKEAATLFEGIEDCNVLSEVTSDARGRNYLEEVLEVERIGRRIRSTRDSCNLITEFENLSKTLQPYIESVKNNHMEVQEGPKCGICQVEEGPAHVKYGINHFHAPCANLYLHMVDPILPIAPVM